ncbi:HNH endonuclease signature motif containing protein [Streptococcus infantis]|uniref:HNH endonuclease signature motif containing protein n=1 Tax=Streptococcus infantis TaxID=68892 RepID=UPI0039C1ADC5
MHEICPGRLTPEVTKLLNEKFGTNYNKSQIGGIRKRLGLPVGKIYQGKLLTKEQHDYLVSIQKNKTSRDVANEMNQKFGLSLTEKQIKSYRRNNNLNSGLTGRFEKGRVPYNKGKKLPNMSPNSGQFKKGNKPPNYVPVGTINYTTDGYPKEKIGEPNKWVLKHRKVWEEHHGPIPKGYSVCFLDRDKTNYDISNLILLSNEELARMNQNNYFSSDPELTKLGAGITKLSRKIKQQE